MVNNCIYKTLEEVEKHFPNKLKRELAQKQAKLFLIDAKNIAQNCGLEKRINNIMQAVFYYHGGVISPDRAIELLKGDIQKT